MANENIVVTGQGVRVGWTIVATSVLLSGGFYISSVLVPIELKLDATLKEQNKQEIRLEITDKRLDGLEATFTTYSIEAIKTEARLSSQLEQLKREYNK